MNRLSNADFDNQLIERLACITPPDDEMLRINPWTEPINTITWGLIFSTLHLNFLYLQYILPTIGILFVYLGFRSLRHINQWFRIAWIISIVQMVLQLVYLANISLPVSDPEQNLVIAMAISSSFYLALFLVFRKAIKEVFLAAKDKPNRDPLLWASLWVVLVSICAIPPLSTNIMIVVPLLVFYFLILRSLFRLGADLANVGYCLINSPVKTSKHWIGIGYLLFCLLLVVGCSIYANHITLDATRYPMAKTTEAVSTLSALGAPASCLAILSAENLSLLEETTQVEVDKSDLNFPTSAGPNLSGLNATTVFFRQPNNDLYIIVFFQRKKGSAVWNDGFYISSPEAFTLLEGSLIYEKDGIRYHAPIPRLYSGWISVTDFFGVSDVKGITGGVSYPFNTEKQQGYVLYYQSAEVSEYAWSGFNYSHYFTPIRLPYRTPEQMLIDGVGNSANHYADCMPPVK